MKSSIVSLADLLGNHRLIRSAQPSIEHVLKKFSQGNSISLVYGETYDELGPTIDSLKYYFFLALLRRELEKLGTSVDATIIIGDLHSAMNKLVSNKAGLLARAHDRLQFVQKISEKFGLRVEPVLMSTLFSSPAFIERLNILRPGFQASTEMQAIARQTVLRNRLKQEKQSGFQYALEEVALITGFDIKIGPPREIHYDSIARSMGGAVGNSDFCGIYLMPTYPLGLNFDYFVTHPEIEAYGLTPYKAGSNKLHSNRIVIGETDISDIKKFINASFIPINPGLPNPVFDLYLIGQMAEALLLNEPLEIDEGLAKDPPAIRQAAFRSVTSNIFKPLAVKEHSNAIR